MDKMKYLHVRCHGRNVGTMALYKERLAIVGSSGMGLLTYEPDYRFEEFLREYLK